MADNAAAARRFFEVVLGTGDWSGAKEIIADDVVLHHPSAPGPITGYDGFQEFLAQFRTAMPDLAFKVHGIAGGGDDETVAVQWSAHGTNTGPLFGMPPSGKAPDISGISFLRFANGKVIEDTIEENTLSVLIQLGVIPPLG